MPEYAKHQRSKPIRELTPQEKEQLSGWFGQFASTAIDTAEDIEMLDKSGDAHEATMRARKRKWHSPI